MNRLTLVIALVFMTLAIPLGWFILRSYESLTREETATMRFVTMTLFDAMEEELAEIVSREEARPVDAWLAGETPEVEMTGAGMAFEKSPWIIGYLQHNPDGSLEMPVQQATFSPEMRAILLTANEEIRRRAAKDDGRFGAAESMQASAEGANQSVGKANKSLDFKNLEFRSSTPSKHAAESFEQNAAPQPQPSLAQEPAVEELPTGEEAPAPGETQVRIALEEIQQAEAVHAQSKANAKKNGEEEAAEKPVATRGEKKADGLLDQVAGMLSGRSRDYLGQDRERTQIVTEDQARNIARLEKSSKQEQNQALLAQRNTPREAKLRKEIQEKDLRESDAVDALAYSLRDVPTGSQELGGGASIASEQNGGLGAHKGDPAEAQARLASQSNAVSGYNPLVQSLMEARNGTDEASADQATPSLDALLAAPPKTSIQVEVAPLQSMVLSQGRIFLYRRVVLGGNIYRQGLLIDGTRFLQHLMDTYFRVQQLPAIANLALSVKDMDRQVEVMADGKPVSETPALQMVRRFPRPFTFLEAEMQCPTIPASEPRSTLNALAWVLAVVMVGGFVAVQRSARALNELSQRRAGFVSSVTHELKTPLTTIRMYAEMLEQGMVPTREREEEYLRTVGTEAERLSRLIGNVLEFSKLEKRSRRFEIQEGDLRDVLDEVRRVLGPSLQQAAFELEEDYRLTKLFAYDREAMVQILLNLVENSIKFCKESPIRRVSIRIGEEEGRVVICVQDTGPGVPPTALSRIFNDFYRVDDSLTRKTKGTGLGLALVKRLAGGMGAKVWARNVEGGGLMICLKFQ